MLLKDWLEREERTLLQFAAGLGRTPEAVRRYIAGERIPDRDTMLLIVSATSGCVTPNDFFGVTTAAEEIPA